MLNKIKSNNFIKFVLLIVLLAIVLLVKPQLLNSDNNNEATLIKQQIDLVDDNITDYILDNDYKVPNQKKIDFNNVIKKAMNEGKLFDSMGLVQDDHDRISKNTYFELNDEYINSQIDTPLSGKFISTNNGDILYIQK